MKQCLAKAVFVVKENIDTRCCRYKDGVFENRNEIENLRDHDYMQTKQLFVEILSSSMLYNPKFAVSHRRHENPGYKKALICV